MSYLRRLLILIAAACLSACASLPGREPVQVAVAGLDALPGEGLEARMLLKLRVQNPNEVPLDYDGVSLKLELNGRTFATGVSDAKGTIPRFGETVIEVPVTVSAVRIAMHAFGMVRDGGSMDKLDYRLSGRLGGPLFGSMSFASEGQLSLPGP